MRTHACIRMHMYKCSYIFMHNKCMQMHEYTYAEVCVCVFFRFIYMPFILSLIVRNPTCAGLPFERLSFDTPKDSLSKDSLSKDSPAQFGARIELLDAIPDSTLSSKQVVPHPSKHDLHQRHDLPPEATVSAKSWSKSIRIGPNKPKWHSRGLGPDAGTRK